MKVWFLLGVSALALGCSAIDYGIPRVNGECFSQCTGDHVCNRQTGLCAFNPCSAGCGEGRHCDPSPPVPRCVNDGEWSSVSPEAPR